MVRFGTETQRPDIARHQNMPGCNQYTIPSQFDSYNGYYSRSSCFTMAAKTNYQLIGGQIYNNNERNQNPGPGAYSIHTYKMHKITIPKGDNPQVTQYQQQSIHNEGVFDQDTEVFL